MSPSWLPREGGLKDHDLHGENWFGPEPPSIIYELHPVEDPQGNKAVEQAKLADDALCLRFANSFCCNWTPSHQRSTDYIPARCLRSCWRSMLRSRLSMK